MLLAILISSLDTKAQISLTAITDPGLQSISGFTPSGLRTGDMDKDGKMDLVMCFKNNPIVQIFLNSSTTAPNRETSFSKPFQFSYIGGNSENFYLGDLNRDGLPEIIISNSGETSIMVIQNNSTPGKLSFGVAEIVIVPLNTSAVTLCDFNSDGFIDIAAACGDKIHVLRNITATKASVPLFDVSLSFEAGATIYDLKCADIDGDGNADIVTATNYGVSVLRNLTSYGANTIAFANASTQKTDRFVHSFDIGDIDNDFRPDLITSNWPNGDFSILPNISGVGNISFGQIIFIEAGSPRGIVLGDFDQDGKFDIAASSTGSGMQITKVFRNISSAEGDFSFAEAQNFVALSDELMVNDFDRDGRDDLAGLNAERNKIEVLSNSIHPLRNTTPETNVYCGEDGKIWMDWQVDIQNKAANYEIEKTQDGNVYTAVAILTDGETVGEKINFNYSDSVSSPNIEYYRLKITAINGDVNYSSLKFGQPCSEAITSFVCSYPNPVDRVMNFSFSLSAEMEMQYTIMNQNMQIQLQKTELVTPGTRTYSLDIMQLQKGSYIFVVKFGNLPPKVCRFDKL